MAKSGHWIVLTGAPSLEALLADESPRHPAHDDHPAWTVVQTPTTEAPYAHVIFADEDITPEGQDANNETSRVSREGQMVLSAGRADNDFTSGPVSLTDHTTRIADSIVLEESSTQEYSFSESMIPPPTQWPNDRSRLERSVLGDLTTEQSIVNLPSWGFSLSSVVRIASLDSNTQSPVNLLALMIELEQPSTIPLKKRGKTGRMEAEKASMVVVDETGGNLDIVMWDEFADKWAGEVLLVGDVVYLERIAVSEYRGKRQGASVDKSRLQVCYRTQGSDRPEEKIYRPNLDLAWDQTSKRVKALVQLAATLGTS